MRLLVICVFIFLSVTFSSHAQNQAEAALNQADSLFESKKFTESFKIYEHLLEQEKLVSRAMLLKMAFIKEGLGDYTNALYYLNLYYLQSADKQALSKMEALAMKKKLLGYAFNDFDFAKTIFFKYFMEIVLALMALAILLMAIMVYRKQKLHHRPIVTAIFTVIVLGLLFYTLNYGKGYNKAIVTKTNTYIMGGPSSGSEVIAIISKGHRLPVFGQEDVWTETEWEGKKAYIKSDKMKLISFL